MIISLKQKKKSQTKDKIEDQYIREYKSEHTERSDKTLHPLLLWFGSSKFYFRIL